MHIENLFFWFILKTPFEKLYHRMSKQFIGRSTEKGSTKSWWDILKLKFLTFQYNYKIWVTCKQTYNKVYIILLANQHFVRQHINPKKKKRKKKIVCYPTILQLEPYTNLISGWCSTHHSWRKEISNVAESFSSSWDPCSTKPMWSTEKFNLL